MGKSDYADYRQIGLAQTGLALTEIAAAPRVAASGFRSLTHSSRDAVTDDENRRRIVIQGRIDFAQQNVQVAERESQSVEWSVVEQELAAAISSVAPTDSNRKAQAHYWLGKTLAIQNKTDQAIEQWVKAKETLSGVLGFTSQASEPNRIPPSRACTIYVQSCLALCEESLRQRNDEQFRKQLSDLEKCYSKRQAELDWVYWAALPYLKMRAALLNNEQATAREAVQDLQRLYQQRRANLLGDEPHIVRAFAVALRDCRQLTELERADLMRSLNELKVKFGWRLSLRDRELLTGALTKPN
jgi:hypothetical protein